MFNQLIEKTKKHVSNIRGWRTNRKIIVLESDDWGAIRMPSKKVYNNLLASGIRVDKSHYNRLDSLERREDLEILYEILSRHKDQKGNHSVMTMNTVMGNPDFDKIKEDDFERYHFEHFFKSYLKYNNDDLSDLWEIGKKNRLIKPQFHAREHLNVNLWMQALKQNYSDTRRAFDHNFYGLKTKTPSDYQTDYLAAYWIEGEKDFKDKERVLEDGLLQFENTFEFSSDSFIACNYVFPRGLEKVLFNNGVRYLQGQRGYLSPNIQTGRKEIMRSYTGKINQCNQIHLVRNCFFEPSFNWSKDWVDSCLNDIKTSFRWKKPAIISTHRINYVSGLEIKNRDRSITQLDQLMSVLLKKWPDIEFMSSDQLGILIKDG